MEYDLTKTQKQYPIDLDLQKVRDYIHSLMDKGKAGPKRAWEMRKISKAIGQKYGYFAGVFAKVYLWNYCKIKESLALTSQEQVMLQNINLIRTIGMFKDRY